MNQIDSFRHVLGLPTPGEEQAAKKVKNEPEGGTPLTGDDHKGVADAMKGKGGRVKKKEQKENVYGRSVSIKADTYAELKALLFWATHEGVIEGNTMDALFKALLQVYYEKTPAAKEFFENFA